MKSSLKKHLPFIIIMFVFLTASVVVTALTIRDEPQYVRVIANPREETTDEVGHATGGSLVNINTATLEELQTLPGIGEVRAADIIAYREAHGDFLYLEELMEIHGIGQSTFDNILEFICL